MAATNKIIAVLFVLGVGVGTASFFPKNSGTESAAKRDNADGVMLVSENGGARKASEPLSLRFQEANAPHFATAPEPSVLVARQGRPKPFRSQNSESKLRRNMWQGNHREFSPMDAPPSPLPLGEASHAAQKQHVLTGLVPVREMKQDSRRKESRDSIHQPNLPADFPSSDDEGYNLRKIYSAVGSLDSPETISDQYRTRIHEVGDGDTLEKLAKVYLGDAKRANEIYHLNRAIISDPALLPIGVDLKIPSRRTRASKEKQTTRTPR